jgi:hypothetical protein
MHVGRTQRSSCEHLTQPQRVLGREGAVVVVEVAVDVAFSGQAAMRFAQFRSALSS